MNSEPKRASQGAFDVTRMSEDDIADAIARQVDEIERGYGGSDVDAMPAPEPAPDGSSDTLPEPDDPGSARMGEDGIAAQPDPLRDRWSSPYSADFSSLIAADDAQSRVTRLLAMSLPRSGADVSEFVDEEDRQPAMRWRPSRAALLGSAALVLVLSTGGWAALWKPEPSTTPSPAAALTILPELPEAAAPVIVQRHAPVMEALPRSKDEKDAAALFYDTAAGASEPDVQADGRLARNPASLPDDGRVAAPAGWPQLSAPEYALHHPAPAAPMALEPLPVVLAAELPVAFPTPKETASGSGLRGAARIPRVDQPAADGAAGTTGAPDAAIATLDPFLAPDKAVGPWHRLLLLTSAVIPGVPSQVPADVGDLQGGTGRGAAGGAVLVKAADAGTIPNIGTAPSNSAEDDSSFETVAADSTDAQDADDSPKDRTGDAKGGGKTGGSGDGGISGQAGDNAAGESDSKADANGKGASQGNKGAGASGSKTAGKGSAEAPGNSGRNTGNDNAAGGKDSGQDTGKADKASDSKNPGKGAGKGATAGGGNAGSETGKSSSKGGGKEGGKGTGDKGGGDKGGGGKGGGGKDGGGKGNGGKGGGNGSGRN